MVGAAGPLPRAKENRMPSTFQPQPTARPWAAALMLTLLLPCPALAIAPDSTDVDAIMKAVEERDRGDKVTTRLKMTIKDASGASRTRVVRSRSMKFDGGRKQLMLFESPEDVRNTGLLSVDYDAASKDDDQWLYLPSLHRSTRISGGDRSGSFMGSDLSYADMTTKDPKVYTYKIVKQDVTVDGERCWLIESAPKTAKEREETGYIKSHVWVSKDKLLPIRVKAWMREGRRLKYSKFGKIKKIDGLWTPLRVQVRTMRAGKRESETLLVFDGMRYGDPSVKASDFSQRRLEQGL